MADGGRVLIIGAGGRMGAALARQFGHTRSVLGWKRADLDISKPALVREAVRRQDFTTVIYTAGTTNVDRCEEYPEESHATNTETPRVLAEVCREKGARLIHVSTDYVFDGNSPALRKETDLAEPICKYGLHKLEGEHAVLDVSPGFLVLRVSWLFGPDRKSFVDMILERALEHDRVEAIADKVSSPTYSIDLAQWIEPMVDDQRYHGLLHLSNAGATSWREYGQKCLDIASELGLPLKTHTVHGVSRKDFPTFKAQRPEYTAFDTTKFRQLSGTEPRSWEDALQEYLREHVVGELSSKLAAAAGT
ncbi:dTDP-4-dehydrorhamnose reductase [Roseimicrobium gellanilyticum]|uniref:dTDP-4-dehydrorhamnose reductase n=2 Tax=Roseimicrobium gellanilyticum TaxID=748857 RepID=A0A366HVC4_9BACT|nr:dTDP-4-dehydrorhamnose reductase [Roseimicrobium gellanilyticum]